MISKILAFNKHSRESMVNDYHIMGIHVLFWLGWDKKLFLVNMHVGYK